MSKRLDELEELAAQVFDSDAEPREEWVTYVQGQVATYYNNDHWREDVELDADTRQRLENLVGRLYGWDA